MGNRQAGSPARPSEVQRAPVWQIFFSSRGAMCVLVHAVPAGAAARLRMPKLRVLPLMPVTAATMRCEVHLHRAATPTRCNREGDEMSRTFCPHPAQVLRGLAPQRAQLGAGFLRGLHFLRLRDVEDDALVALAQVGQ